MHAKPPTGRFVVARPIGNPLGIEAEHDTRRRVYGTLRPEQYPAIVDSADELDEQLQDTPVCPTLGLLLAAMADTPWTSPS